MKHARITATLSILALALVGCGTTESDSEPQATTETAEQPQPQQTPTEDPMAQDSTADQPYSGHADSYPTDHTYFFYTPEGALAKFDIPSEPSEDVSYVFNRLLPEDDASFVKVTVDNREGSEVVMMDNIVGHDEAGKEYRFQDFSASMAEPLWDVWENIDIHDDAAMAEYDGLEANPAMNMDTYVDPGALKDVWLISQEAELPDEFTTLGANGGGTYAGGSEVHSAEHAEDAGVDLNFEAPTN